MEESTTWAENAGWQYAEEKTRAAARARQQLIEMRGKTAAAGVSTASEIETVSDRDANVR